ncbi:MAG TPA: RNA 2',3'-cyclic phosphodiesterase [Propionibacterium sp.]|jgi:2'-5' RNA ligase|nr:RNA 2',3'-cyclic phosphodiesterase [Propionibacterium sp.]
MTGRTFAAVVPPPHVIEEMEDYIAPRREADRRLSWVWPEHWHITTLFIEDLPDRSLDPLLEGLGALAARTQRFAVRLAGGGCFPDPFQAKVFYLGVTTGQETLAALSKTGRALASTVGAPPDGARFVPHVTLARTRTRFDGTRWLGVLDSFGAFDWEATELTLIRSHLRQGQRKRSRYEVLGRFPFKSEAARPDPSRPRRGPIDTAEERWARPVSVLEREARARESGNHWRG